MSEVAALPEQTTPNSASEILDAARSLYEFIDGAAAACEAERRLVPPVVEALQDAGAFRMTMPRSWGGPELTTLEQIEVIEAISMADASAGWCVMIGCDSGLYSGFVEEGAARELWPDLDMIQAGWIHPGGRADRVDGGYLVSGQWMFCSGSSHAHNIAGGCLVYRDGEPELVDGQRQWRIVVAPRSDWHVQDVWHTTGLRATASNDYTTREDSLFIPEAHCLSFESPHREGPLWARPDALLRKMSGIPLGLARRVIEDVKALVAEKVERPSGRPYRELDRVRTAIGNAEMLLGAARSYVFSSLELQWRKIETNEPLSKKERADVWLSRLNAFQASRAIVRDLYDVIGGSAIYEGRSILDRALRDAETMCQHVVGQRRELAKIGGLLLNDPREDRNMLVPR